MLGSKVSLRMAVGGSHIHRCCYVIARPTARVFAASKSPKVTLISRRNYATPGRPKKAVGEPTKTVKRAVKRVASDKTAETAAAVKEKEKTKKAKANAKTAATAPKKTKANAKAAPTTTKKTKTKKVFTPEQQEKLDKTLAQAVIKDLKKLVLSPPHSRPVATWVTFNGAKTKEHLKGETGGDIRGKLAEAVKRASQEYKNLSTAELEHWNHLTNEANAKKAAEYNAWLEARTPDEIRIANLARKKLRLKLGDKAKGYHPIHDDRLVKRPMSSYIFFSLDRFASKDFSHIKITEAAKLASEEWKALTDGEKQKYNDMAAKEQERYIKEYQDVYGHAPDATVSSTTSA